METSLFLLFSGNKRNNLLCNPHTDPAGLFLLIASTGKSSDKIHLYSECLPTVRHTQTHPRYSVVQHQSKAKPLGSQGYSAPVASVRLPLGVERREEREPYKTAPRLSRLEVNILTVPTLAVILHRAYTMRTFGKSCVDHMRQPNTFICREFQLVDFLAIVFHYTAHSVILEG